MSIHFQQGLRTLHFVCRKWDHSEDHDIDLNNNIVHISIEVSMNALEKQPVNNEIIRDLIGFLSTFVVTGKGGRGRGFCSEKLKILIILSKGMYNMQNVA